MKFLLIIFFVFINSILVAKEFYYNFGQKIFLNKSEKYIGIKTKYELSKESLKKQLEKNKNISDIVEIKNLGKKIFLIKFSDKINEEELKKLSFTDYFIKGYYLKRQDVWPRFVDRRIIVKFKNYVTETRIRNILEKNSLYLIDKKQNLYDFLILKTTKSEPLKLANKMISYKEVLYSYPDFISIFKKYYYPNDTYFQNQWHHKKGVGGVDSVEAWDISFGSKSVKIAIIDDGIDLAHEDLNVIAYKNFSTEDENAGAEHGTACAGVAAAKGDNLKGMIGLCPNCSLISAKILSESGAVYNSAVSEAFKWAAFKGADIFSNSWGSQEPTPISENLKFTIDYIISNARRGKGGIILFAVGNDYRELYPYEIPSQSNIIAVGASDYKDERALYSNFGDYIDVVAPSSVGDYNSFSIPEGNIWTTDRSGSEGYNNNGVNSQYNYFSEVDEAGNYTRFFGGTSSATPLVAGLSGLILSTSPNLRFEKVIEILKDTADKIGGEGEYENGYSENFGYGKVNAYKALLKAKELSTCVPNINGEICNNSVDDDCDGFVDFNDSDCNNYDPCIEYSCPENSKCVFNDAFNPSSYNSINISCKCKEGFIKNEDGDCIPDPDYDPCKNISCSGHGKCVSENDILKCDCDEGFHNEGNGLICRMNNLCTGVVCGENSFCLTDDGKCHCKRGFYREGGECKKYKEGSLCEFAMCDDNAKCNNKDGECYCNDGYVEIEDGKCIKDKNSGKDNSGEELKNEKNEGGCSYSGAFGVNFIFIVMFLLFLNLFKKNYKIKN